jgi:membrane-bound lytic murein transglycosylase D
MQLRLRGFLIILTMLVLAACANQPTPAPPARIPITSNDAVFPAPPALQPQIAFWQNVYAGWARSQVALHDNRHMDLIYEVITLPGPVSESYSDSQKAWLKTRYESLRATLSVLESKVMSRTPLTSGEQALAARIQSSSGGPGAIVGASDRLRSQRGLRERFKRGLEISGRYDAVFRQTFREAGLPEDLAYLPHVEMMNTAVDERRDPVASAQGAARYLSNAYSRLDSWPLAITSYNHGVGGMARAKAEVGSDITAIVQRYSGKGFGFASRNFYAEFLAARNIARNPQRFFPEGLSYEPSLNQDRIRLRQAVAVHTLASYYEVNAGELAALNRAWNPPAQNGRIPLPAGTMVWLPAGTMARLAQRGAADRALVLAEPVSTAQRR